LWPNAHLMWATKRPCGSWTPNVTANKGNLAHIGNAEAANRTEYPRLPEWSDHFQMFDLLRRQKCDLTSQLVDMGWGPGTSEKTNGKYSKSGRALMTFWDCFNFTFAKSVQSQFRRKTLRVVHTTLWACYRPTSTFFDWTVNAVLPDETIGSSCSAIVRWSRGRSGPLIDTCIRRIDDRDIQRRDNFFRIICLWFLSGLFFISEHPPLLSDGAIWPSQDPSFRKCLTRKELNLSKKS
jgi:hypothetical protein